MRTTTLEKQASTKNGMSRMMVACLAILLQIILLILLVTVLNDYAVGIQIFIQVIAVILVLKIYGQHKTASMKMPWIILTILSPILGVVLYFLVGTDGYSRIMKRRYRQIDAELMQDLSAGAEVIGRLEETDPDMLAVSLYIHRNARYPVYQNSQITYYDNATDALEAQLRQLRRAEHFIFMEYHAIEDAQSWHRIQEVLEDRVQHGVEVRVFYDDMGSIGFVNTDFAVKLRGLGIQCRVFNPFVPFVNIFLNNRDHRKITVIDGRVGFTGGYNLANEYFNVTHPYGDWKDTGIMITGAAVRSLTVTFLEMWNVVLRQGPEDESYDPYLPNPAGVASLPQTDSPKASSADGSASDPAASEWGTDSQNAASSGGEETVSGGCGFVQPYADSPMDEERVGENVYIAMINRANRYCWFMTPYLIITDEMTHALGMAAKRGVDVRIITPGIPDKKLVYSVTRSFYNGLTRNGVRIFEWTPGFCHAKMCLVDGKMATCGTINLDYRSFYHHFENGCFFCDCNAVQDMKEDFEQTFAQCREVTQQYLTGRSSTLRLWQLFLRLFAPLM